MSDRGDSPEPEAEALAPALSLARRVAEAMRARDAALTLLGIELEDIGPGHARLAMTIRADMLNSHGIGHGGLIFTLADSAFAYACNSRNESTVAAGCSIEFLRPARLGERLVARAEERVLSGRTGIYDISVSGDGGEPVAVFRGKSARIKGEVLAT